MSQIVTAKKNPFDAIAKKAPATGKKPSKVQANVTDDIKAQVDQFVSIKGQIDSLSAKKEQCQDKIISHVRPQQDDLAYNGEFTKSLSVPGNIGELTYVTTDRFSLPKEEEAQQALKDLFGEHFDECFKTKRTIVLKETVQEDEVFMDKLIKAVKAAGRDFADTFDVTDSLVQKPDLDQKQYQFISKDKLETFRSLAKQYSPSLK